ncbi:hypothetical protein [Novosphingobium sp. ST904]|uniref:hypothetical protein n=1 Tax=Novosphingobium sp. ST904 TaxID=1684385 RepID=UPI000B2AA200|nr:hypothetical protein [Novosphingobium sp. ST904]
MPSLGRIGIWSMELRFGDRAQAELAAAELDELGYGTLWIPGGIGGDITGDIDRLLGAPRMRPSRPASSISGCMIPPKSRPGGSACRMTGSSGFFSGSV